MAYDPVARWTQSPSVNVNQYNVSWTRNGVQAGTIVVTNPSGGSPGSFTYQTDWNACNPSPPVAGDVLTVSVTAIDTVDNLSSAAVTPAPLTIPATPPDPPVNVTLTLT